MNKTLLLIGGLGLVVVIVVGLRMLAMSDVQNGEVEMTSPTTSLPPRGTILPADVLKESMGDEMIVSETTSAASPIASSAPTVSTGSKEFTVAATNFAFSPAEIRVKQGDTVRITLTNNSTMSHDWRVDEFTAATKIIQGGQQDTITFVASKTGQFEYYCSVGNHRQMGMKGTLIVE